MSCQLKSAPTIRNKKKKKPINQVKRNAAFFFSRGSNCLQHASSEQINRCKSLQKKGANIRTGITNYCVNEAAATTAAALSPPLSLLKKKRYNFLDPSLQTPKCTSKCEEPQVKWLYGAQITKKPTTPTGKRNQNAINAVAEASPPARSREPFASACTRRTTRYGWKIRPTSMRKESY